MKAKLTHMIFGMVIGLIAIGAGVPAFAQDNTQLDETDAAAQERNERDLVGVWIVKLTRRDCATGAPIGPVSTAQLTFAKGGTMLEIIPPTNLRTAANGLWRRAGGPGNYAFGMSFLRYDAAGAHIGSMIVRATIKMDRDGGTYSATANNDVIDLNGNVIGVGCATSEGTRFQWERRGRSDAEELIFD